MGKIIFLDIDGTIRWFDGSVPDSTVYAIQEARRRGHEVCVCSGRPLSLIEKNILDIGFDGIVSCAGTYVMYRGQCVRSVSFDPATVHELCEYLVEKDCMIELQRFDQTFLLKRFVSRYEEMGRNMMASLGEDAKELEPYPGLVEQDTDVKNVELKY